MRVLEIHDPISLYAMAKEADFMSKHHVNSLTEKAYANFRNAAIQLADQILRPQQPQENEQEQP